ncbi:WecA-like glycosyltransferase [Rosistilla carotiformis]|uniref:WecA-like glycosyltransferase n=1 Tax=Rosistilla carotiformis TaxID=2528017 RepID=A0A518JPC8_9BACT|nr:MraY family glycosyltransferase [Rosistilla carotiformis]QDV67397.1 WecA-like glycosyltransferase [Rosistilla carotiformis]
MFTLASLCGTIALIAGLLLVPIVRALARKIGIVDRPDPTRKLHSGAIALGGGVAVFSASLIAIFVTLFYLAPVQLGTEVTIPSGWSTLLLCSLLIVVLGLVDDWLTLRGRQKLLGQIMIVAMLVGGGLVGEGTVIRHADLFGIPIELGIFALPLTMLWLLGAINALNLVDGADGVASTMGSIICIGLAIIAFSRGELIEGAVSIALAGGLVAFLAFNRPPATIFLGDSGSMMIGLVVGTLAAWTSTKESTAIAVIIPIAVLSVPLFDSTIAILRRVLTGRSIYAADRAHMHHVLKAYLDSKGYPQGWMLVIVAILTVIPVAGATASVIWNEPAYALLATGVVLGGMVLTKSFGHAELSLLARRSASFGTSLLTRSHHADDVVRHTSIRLQGSRNWDVAWATLVEYAEQHDLWRIKLDLNVAWLHEGFHGEWQRSRLPERAVQWTMRFPVEVDGRQVGNMDIVGRGGGLATYQLMETLLALIVDLQPHFESIVKDDPRSMPSEPIRRPRLENRPSPGDVSQTAAHT